MSTFTNTYSGANETVIRVSWRSLNLGRIGLAAASLLAGFTVASALAFIPTSIGSAESIRVLAALAGSLGWIYLAMAIDEEHTRDALADLASFVLTLGFALLSLKGMPGLVAAAFAVHTVHAVMRLARSRCNSASQHGLLAWSGFGLGSVLVVLAVLL